MATKTKTAAKKPPVTTAKSAKVKAKKKADIDQEVEDEEEIEDEENQLDAEDGDEQDQSAEDDETEESAEGDDDEERVDDQKGAEDDEDETAEDEEKPAQSRKSKKALGGERGRIAAILQSNAAQGRREQAEHLAFNTDISARDAVNILKAAPRSSGASAGVPDFRKALAGANPKIGSGGAAAKPTGVDAEVAETIALAKKAGFA